MRRFMGLTLIETLLAVVLLALVIGACTPYLRRAPARAPLSSDSGWSDSEFSVEVMQRVEQRRLSAGADLDFEAYADLAVTNGWVCRRTAVSGKKPEADQALGEWVELSDGTGSTLWWAVREPVEKAGVP